MKIQLNENQQQAVSHEKGPGLVIAGAGTGKTRVITERIRSLIQKSKIDPQEILALTFTEKAAQEMLDRIGDAMPLGYEEPWVSTFHSFSDRVLKREGIEIGIDPAYKILTYPDQWMLLRKNLFKMELDYFRPRGNPTKFISAILKFISRLQDENILPDDLKNFAEDFEGIPEEKDRWSELAYIYEKYTDFKIESSRLDFGDLITWTIKLFKDRPNILEKYQKQFKHILVDEFQDTNYAQYEMLKMLFPVTVESSRSLLAVGDDSQSIYKFRGAAISNIMQFRDDYKECETITLVKNYRSYQEILDPAYKVIQNNNPDTLESKLGISKELISQKGDSGVDPEILKAPTTEDETDVIINKIVEVLQNEPELSFKDIAILARANNHLEPILLALRDKKIPYQLVGNRGLYDRDEIRDVIALLKVVINPRQQISLYRALNIESLNIPKQTISDLLMTAKYEKIDLWEALERSDNKDLVVFKSLLQEYQGKIVKDSPVQFVYTLVKKIKYIEKFTKEESLENQLCIRNLDLFLEKIKRFESNFYGETNEIPTIIDLLDYIEQAIEAGDNPAQAEIEDVDTIKLMTVHASKGLEFECVFVINLVAGRFPTRNRKDIIDIPDELIKEILPTGNEHIQEERRLFYVAMTRAKKYLYFTLAKNYGGVRDTHNSGFLEETDIQIKETQDANDRPKQSGIFGLESGYRDIKRIENFEPKFLSYSQISMYEDCPFKYRYKYVLNVPTEPSHALSFGITIHDTLRDYHQKKLFNDVSFAELLNIYEKNWQPLGYYSEEHRKTRFEEGKELLEQYYKKHNDENIKHLSLEKSFNIKIAGIKFYGRIDRIDKLPDGGVEIIDYKTGALQDQKKVDKDKQIGFYAIAAKEAFKLNPEKLTYYFLEAGEQVSTTRNDTQLDKLTDTVEEVVDEIKKGNFEAKPGMQCNWCDYQDICPHAWKG